MYSRILVPLDGSDASIFGLAEAIRLARNQDAALRLVHVIDTFPVVMPEAVVFADQGAYDAIRESGRRLLQEHEASVRNAGVSVDSVLVEAMGSQAGLLILQQAREWRASLIAMGTHGRRGVRRLLLGSDAEIVVRHTTVPLLLVRAHESM